MSQGRLVATSDFQRLVVEQALAYARQLEHAAAAAPHGQALDRCELATLQHGRQFLRDCAWLYARQSIGSGLVEGAAKNLVGKRLKQTAARWKLDNVHKMAALCCCTCSGFWPRYWNAA